MVYVLLILGFALLIKGADHLVKGASSLAKILKVSDLIIGLTIVSFGTSMPEFVVNIVASFKGNSEIAISNIIGSNIFNILVILGVSSVILPLIVTKRTVWIEIPITLLAVAVFGLMANSHIVTKSDFHGLSRMNGLILLAFLAGFMYYIFHIAKKEKNSFIASESEHIPILSLPKSIVSVIVGFLGLAVGAQLVVNSAVNVADKLGVSHNLIGLTIVAAGTGLPELATSAVAAYKKNSDIAVGNIVGSNILNVFMVLGISSTLKPIPLQPRNNIDIGVAIFASLILFITMFTGKKRILERWEGIIFLTIYIAYTAYLIKLG